MEIEITKITSKGQVVIPQSIRRRAGLKEGERFLVYNNRDSIILKRTKDLESVGDVDEFEKTFKSMWKIATERKLSKDDVEKEIKEARHSKRHVKGSY